MTMGLILDNVLNNHDVSNYIFDIALTHLGKLFYGLPFSSTLESKLKLSNVSSSNYIL